MPESTTPPSSHDESALQIAMPDVVRFVRQLSHDLRNHLNALELQSAFILEIAQDAELKGEVKRFRGMMSELATSLQKLSMAMSEVRLTEMPYEAANVVEDLQEKVTGCFPEESGSVEWNAEGVTGIINADPQLLQEALVELFRNAFRHGRGEGKLGVRARSSDHHLKIEIEEPKQEFATQTQSWGREPFRNLKPGCYGLGLHRARRIIEAHGGEYGAVYDAAKSSLITAVTLPLAVA